MLRYRRYRVFLVFAVLTVFALYKFGSSSTSWKEQAARLSQSKQLDNDDRPKLNWQPKPQVAKETKKFEVEVPAAKTPQAKQTPPPIAPVSRPVEKKPSPSPKKATAKPTPVGVGGIENDDATQPDFTPIAEGGQGALEVTPMLGSTLHEVIHWRKPTEHFPVPSKSLIRLPSGKPKPMPKIQFDFKKESPSERQDRESKLNTIRDVFKRSWDGYKAHAWLHDELKPVSGEHKDPFAGWGATLVDALDTLWIMGLKEEFVEAVEAVNKIDFTTTPRPDIPLFETTIRYLGGLLAAYDISGEKHKILLDKAVELAEVLISAFDTPNRMPETYYYWRPDFSSNAHRASNRVVLAEIGSLSVEFTRLAQLTGEHKYYDAVARITDNFEEFQNKTRLPGMWPTHLDASGCKAIDWSAEVNKPLQKPLPAEDADQTSTAIDTPVSHTAETLVATATEELSPEGHKYVPLKKPEAWVVTPNGPNPTWKPPPEEPLPIMLGEPGKAKILGWDDGKRAKRQLDLGEPAGKGKIKNWDDSTRQLDLNAPAPSSTGLSSASTSTETDAAPAPSETGPSCVEQGFATSSSYGPDEFTLGGESDSTYEYLPKEYMLLGGQVEKYRTMYEKSADVVKKHLIFRPMLPEDNDILFSGKLTVPSLSEPKKKIGDLEPENAHLTCFAGGMFGMAAKLFDRPDDLKIAKKLTEGCVYSYNMTATGIMPEAFVAVPCDSTESCSWNETKYYEVLDPRADARMEQYKQAMKVYNEQMSSASAWYEEELQAMSTAPPAPVDTELATNEALPTPTVTADILDKRQLADLEDDVTPTASLAASQMQTSPATHVSQDRDSVMGGEAEEAEGPPTPIQPDSAESPSPSRTAPVFPVIYSPKAPLNHEEHVKNRIQEERLPLGVSSIKSRNYILRPEAIESVWYMYRITGDPHWRAAGWSMFEAINAHTATLYGNSAIDDVTRASPTLDDSMESFWLAETLKYFYLLFETEDVVSLDEWVLNTEAHPFKRPT